jgi:hypothetical protein
LGGELLGNEEPDGVRIGASDRFCRMAAGGAALAEECAVVVGIFTTTTRLAQFGAQR